MRHLCVDVPTFSKTTFKESFSIFLQLFILLIGTCGITCRCLLLHIWRGTSLDSSLCNLSWSLQYVFDCRCCSCTLNVLTDCCGSFCFFRSHFYMLLRSCGPIIFFHFRHISVGKSSILTCAQTFLGSCVLNITLKCTIHVHIMV